MATPQDRAFTGAFGRVLWNKKKVGYLQGVNGSERITREQVREVGDIFLIEAPVIKVDCEMRADFIEIPSQGLQKMGIFPRGSAIDYIEFPELTVEIVNLYGQLVRKAEGVMPNGYNWRLDLNSVWRVDTDFTVRRFFDSEDIGA